MYIDNEGKNKVTTITLYIYSLKRHTATIKVKVFSRTGHEDPEGEQMYSSTLPSTSALDEGG